MTDLLAEFAAHRPVLLAAAYRITGSREDAEDVVQETWLRWAQVDPDQVRSPRAMLAVMASRLALNSVRSRARRREEYVGPWLPEPIARDGDAEWEVLHRDGLGHALDVVLSQVGPEQATAYVLRKVLEVDYAQIAQVLEVSQAAARQLVSRAQRAIAAQLPGPVWERTQREAAALAALAEAVSTGEVARVVELLAPDSVLYSDGGGRVSSALRPIRGADKVARFILGIANGAGMRAEPVVLNGGAGAAVWIGDEVTTVSVAVAEGGVSALFLVRNPEKVPPALRR